MANATDVKFAQDMIPHHQSAVEMAVEMLGSGEDPEMRALAQSIAEGQSAEIGRLRAWLAQNGGGAADGSAPRKPTGRPDWSMSGMG